MFNKTPPPPPSSHFPPNAVQGESQNPQQKALPALPQTFGSSGSQSGIHTRNFGAARGNQLYKQFNSMKALPQTPGRFTAQQMPPQSFPQTNHVMTQAQGPWGESHHVQVFLPPGVQVPVQQIQVAVPPGQQVDIQLALQQWGSNQPQSNFTQPQQPWGMPLQQQQYPSNFPQQQQLSLPQQQQYPSQQPQQPQQPQQFQQFQQFPQQPQFPPPPSLGGQFNISPSSSSAATSGAQGLGTNRTEEMNAFRNTYFDLYGSGGYSNGGGSHGTWSAEGPVQNKHIADYLEANPTATTAQCIDHLINNGYIQVSHTPSSFSEARGGLPPGDAAEVVKSQVDASIRERVNRWKTMAGTLG